MHDLIYIKTKSNIYAQVHEHMQEKIWEDNIKLSPRLLLERDMQEKIWEDKYQTITRITFGKRNGICGRQSREELRYGG